MRWLLVSLAVGLVAGALVTTFGAPGQLVGLLLLALAAATRSLPLGIVVALSGAVPFFLYALAMARCEPKLGPTCTFTDGSGLMLAMAGLIALGGTLIALREWRLRHRDALGR